MINETFISMCREAWPYLKEHMSERKTDELLCDGYYVGFKTLDYDEFSEKNEYTYHIIYKIKESFDTEEFKVPRQEDLQEIILKNKPWETYELIISFEGWWEDQFAKHRLSIKEMNKLSVTQLWLSFVMEMCYDKQWNGETWVEL